MGLLSAQAWAGTDEIFKDGFEVSLGLARIEVTPSSVLFTGTGQFTQLEATVYDDAGLVVDAGITWSSSAGGVVDVDPDGVVSSLTNLGSAQITASGAGLISAPVPIMVAEPAANALLVKDDDILGPIELVDPNAPLALGIQYRAVIADNIAVLTGELLIGAEGRPLAGRVVATVPVAGGTEVTLEVVPLTELFRNLDVDLTTDLTQIRGSNPASGPLTSGSPDKGGNEISFMLGPFECKVSIMPTISGSLFQLKINQQLAMNFAVKITDGQLERLKVKLDGSVGGEMTAGVDLTAAFNGSINCRAVIKEFQIPTPAPIAILFGPVVPVGVGLNLGGSLQLALLQLQAQGSASAAMSLGFDYQALSGFTTFEEFTPDVKFEVIQHFTQDIVNELRVTAGVYPHAFAEIASRGIVGQVLAAGTEGGGSFGILSTSFGSELKGNLATEAGQAADPAYRSNYDLNLLSKAGLAGDLGNLFKLFDGLDITVVDLSLTQELLLAQSPTGTLSTDQVAAVEVDGEVTLTVNLAPDQVDFPFIGYNVDEVIFYRVQGAGLERMETVAATAGQTQFDWVWTPTVGDVGENSFVAFLTTQGVPGIPLEVADNSTLTIEVTGSGSTSLSYSALLGGGLQDFGFDLALDDEGNIYLATAEDNGNDYDVVAYKLNPAGDTILYKKVINGGNDDYALGIAVDGAGHAYLAGQTDSESFPTVGGVQSVYGGSGDAFVVKLSTDGSTIEYATYLGGNEFDFAHGIAVDAAGHAYVTGFASDYDDMDPFPGIEDLHNGVFVSKLSPDGGSLIYSTCSDYCSTSDFRTIGTGIAVGPDGSAYVAAATSLARLSPDGQSVLYRVGVGGIEASEVTLDPSGNAYVVGTAVTVVGTTFNDDIAIAKYDPDGARRLRRVLGGEGDDRAYDIAVDANGFIYVVGDTRSAEFPVLDPVQSDLNGIMDAIVVRWTPMGDLSYATYLGGNAWEGNGAFGPDSMGIAVKGSTAIITGATGSANFPISGTVPGGGGGASDIFVSKIELIQPQ